MIKNIVFDMGNVLVRGVTTVIAATAIWLR